MPKIRMLVFVAVVVAIGCSPLSVLAGGDDDMMALQTTLGATLLLIYYEMDQISQETQVMEAEMVEHLITGRPSDLLLVSENSTSETAEESAAVTDLLSSIEAQ